MNREQELKPCPFCGSGEVSSEGTVDNVMFCGNCGAFGPHPAYDEATWNTRAALEPAPKVTEEAVERAAKFEDALDSIRRYGLDTLSGRIDGPADAKWYRDGVHEMTRRANAALEAAQGGEG